MWEWPPSTDQASAHTNKWPHLSKDVNTNDQLIEVRSLIDAICQYQRSKSSGPLLNSSDHQRFLKKNLWTLVQPIDIYITPKGLCCLRPVQPDPRCCGFILNFMSFGSSGDSSTGNTSWNPKQYKFTSSMGSNIIIKLCLIAIR